MDPHPRCKAGQQPLAPRRYLLSPASVSSAKPRGWKMWQPATERLQVRGTTAAGGQPGGGGARASGAEVAPLPTCRDLPKAIL